MYRYARVRVRVRLYWYASLCMAQEKGHCARTFMRVVFWLVLTLSMRIRPTIGQTINFFFFERLFCISDVEALIQEQVRLFFRRRNYEWAKFELMLSFLVYRLLFRQAIWPKTRSENKFHFLAITEITSRAIRRWCPWRPKTLFVATVGWLVRPIPFGQ